MDIYDDVDGVYLLISFKIEEEIVMSLLDRVGVIADGIVVIIVIILFGGMILYGSDAVGQCEAGGGYEVLVNDGSYLRLRPGVGDIDGRYMGNRNVVGFFNGFRSTWIFKYEVDAADESVWDFVPSRYSGIDIGYCDVGDVTVIYFYPNPFYERVYSKRRFLVRLLRSSVDESDGHILYVFKYLDGGARSFIIEAYTERGLYKMITPCGDIMVMYQIVSHGFKLK